MAARITQKNCDKRDVDEKPKRIALVRYRGVNTDSIDIAESIDITESIDVYVQCVLNQGVQLVVLNQ